MHFSSILLPQAPTKPLETERMPDTKCGGCGCSKTALLSCEGSRVLKLKVCGSCNSPDRYCGKSCFRLDWKQHRVQCKQTCSWKGCMTDLDLLENCKKYKCPCLNKRYCGPVCQKSDWNSGHKDECRQTLKDPAKMMSKIRAIRATIYIMEQREELVRRTPSGTSMEEYFALMRQGWSTWLEGAKEYSLAEFNKV